MSDTLSIPAKRHRPCRSEGSLSDLLSPGMGTTAAPLADVVTLFNSKVSQLTDDEEHKEYLACPFWKHNPVRYLRVKSSCTDGFGFKNIGKLTEHIKRVHCLWNGCEKCRKRFNKAKKEEVDEIKRRHMIGCTQPTKDLTELDAEWMDKDQDEAYGQLNFQRNKATPSQCYEKICRALWGSEKLEISEPYHLPGFQMSVLRWQFIKDLQSLCGQKNVERPLPDARQDVAVAALSPPSAEHVDPVLLSTQTLDNLSSAPPPFFRGQHRKDSGVWSFDPSEPPFARPALPDFAHEEALEEYDSEQEQNNSDYYIAGTWAGLADPYGFPVGQFDRDADGDDFLG
ncbi:hypothetical protein K445DRAFT_303990 [Daldinia sp. EC12]|nr:hypothetical protein K445DRAFT_303990 [Daldinia sp. EC12]